MRKVTITLTDCPNGDVDFSVDFGGEVDNDSKAHYTGLWIINELFEAKDTFNTVTDEGENDGI